MMAVRVHAFGGPEALVYEEVPRPSPAAGEVLVRVHAAGVNPPDWYARGGFTQIPEELRPSVTFPFTPGTDVSGEVAEVGAEVRGLSEGDRVFGLIRFPPKEIRGGGYAGYLTAPADQLAIVPDGLDHVTAAAVPMAGLTALQYLFDHMRLRSGTRILINGAAGGVGHFAVQLAKTRDAYVIAVASGRHEEFLRGLGVDEFIDYTHTPAERVVRGADYVLDTVGGPEGHRFLSVLGRGGVLSPVFHGEFHPDRATELGITIMLRQVRSDGAGMTELARLLKSGQLRAGIDSVYPLAEAATAHKRAEAGHLQGKLVLRVR